MASASTMTTTPEHRICSRLQVLRYLELSLKLLVCFPLALVIMWMLNVGWICLVFTLVAQLGRLVLSQILQVSPGGLVLAALVCSSFSRMLLGFVWHGFFLEGCGVDLVIEFQGANSWKKSQPIFEYPLLSSEEPLHVGKNGIQPRRLQPLLFRE